MKAISLFSGAGGLDSGFELAGFRIAVAVEMDRDSVATLRANRDWPILDRDIHEVSSQQILRAAGLRVGEADVLIGGPPCQPFSKSGFWARGETLRLDDPRASTLEAYLRVLRDTLPRAFLLENVEGIAYRGKSEALELVQRALDEINLSRRSRYSFTVAKLNAADLGVPQQRERIFVIGCREGHTYRFPVRTHGSGAATPLFDLLEPYTTAWDAIGDLEDDDDPALHLTGRWASLLPSIPEGSNYLWHTSRGGGAPLFGWRRRYWSFLLKLAKDQPSWTIQAQPGPATGPFHWRNRHLSARELCRLQTFPEGYRVVGDARSVQRQLGNAVPSAVAEILAQSIRQQVLGHRAPLRSRLIPARRRPLPAPEPVLSVPEAYLRLAGDHQPHPGTGLGYGAAMREASR